MKYFKFLMIALLAILLVLSACPKPAPTPTPALFPMTITDQLGREVIFEKTPQRIVSLAPSNTEILFALGLGDKIVGVDQHSNYPPETQKIEKVGGFATLDPEKIVALNPDLILAANIHKKEVIPVLEARGLKVVALDPENLEELLEGIALVGKITRAEKTPILIDTLKQRIKTVTNKTQKLPPEKRPRAFYITWHDPIWTTGSGTFQHDLIEKAGGVNIFADLTEWKTVTLEEVIARNPQVIIAPVGHGVVGDLSLKWAQTEPRLEHTEARKNNRIYQVDEDIFSRPGPRLVDALETLAKLLHPELF